MSHIRNIFLLKLTGELLSNRRNIVVAPSNAAVIVFPSTNQDFISHERDFHNAISVLSTLVPRNHFMNLTLFSTTRPMAHIVCATSGISAEQVLWDQLTYPPEFGERWAPLPVQQLN